MNLNSISSIAPELMYELDSLYVSTEIILSRQFREVPIDGLLLEACLLHFRVVWEFSTDPKRWELTLSSATTFQPGKRGCHQQD
jgi:hypothetical protein